MPSLDTLGHQSEAVRWRDMLAAKTTSHHGRSGRSTGKARGSRSLHHKTFCGLPDGRLLSETCLQAKIQPPSMSPRSATKGGDSIVCKTVAGSRPACVGSTKAGKGDSPESSSS